MEFAKFVAMLMDGGLWFANAQALAKDDPFEGCLPKPHYHKWVPADLPLDLIEQVTAGAPDKDKALKRYLHMMSMQPALALHYRKAFLLNCWHRSSHEAAAMWKAYGKHDGGVAITSSLFRMREGLKSYSEQVYCGKIQYIDFETGVIPVGNLFNTILRKRQSFSSENEVRLVRSDFGPMDTSNPTAPVDGLLVPCPLNDLIEEIWISPTAPPWLESTVKSVCKLAGLNSHVRHSTLLDQPASPPVAMHDAVDA